MNREIPGKKKAFIKNLHIKILVWLDGGGLLWYIDRAKILGIKEFYAACIGLKNYFY
jgi:hypothetical protein